MSDRYTKQDVYRAFTSLCAALDKAPGSYSIDHNATYGGWVIVENLPEGGESRPFGDRRRSTAEMVRTMQFATCAVGNVKESMLYYIR